MAKQGKRVKAKKLKPKINRRKLIIGIIVGVMSLVIYSQIAHYTKQARLERELQQQTKALEVKVKELQNTSEQSNSRQKQIEALQKDLEQKTKELQAKRENQARALAEASQTVSKPAVVSTVAVSGTCADWIAQAGVNDVASAIELIRRESGCNPNAVNRSSGACGIAQELPCGKSGCGLGNPVCQIKWMQNYVNARYGGWANAIAWHNSHNWY
jgi:type II secretory pathway pseudopilin PulG